MLVSIIMPVYNNIDYISESIISVQKQTYKDWELIIIDDGSEIDIYGQLTENIKDNRIKYFRLDKNRGVAFARNRAIELASGRYIAFLDSDDIWLPDKLERQISFMNLNKAAVSCTQYRRFHANIGNVSKIIDVAEKISYEKLLKGNQLGCLTVMIDRYFISEIRMPEMRHEDYITWLNIAKEGNNIYGLKEDLARYRVLDKSVSSNKWKSIKWTWDVYRKSQKLSIAKSIYYFWFYMFQGITKRL